MASGWKPFAGSASRRREDVVGREGEVLDRRAEALGDEMAGQRAAVLRAVQRQAQRAVAALDHLAAHQPGRIDDVDHRQLPVAKIEV